jgi:plastocyanin
MSSWSAAAVIVLIATCGSAPAGLNVHGTARGGSRPEANAVVWLEAPGAPPAAQTSTVVLDQRNLRFSPTVLAVRVGTIVQFPNHDRVFHNVFSFHDGKRFDLGLYPVGTRRDVVFNRPGLSRIFCNIHPNMAAYVLTIDTPYFAVSDANGRFTIAGVPPGRYTYRAWRPGRSELNGTVVVNADSTLDIHWP